MKIAFFEVDAEQQEYLKDAFPEAHYSAEILTPQTAPTYADVEIIVIRVYTRVTEELLAALPAAKLILSMSTGTDHLDLEACKKKNVMACNVTGYGDNAVAEHVFALLLALAKNIVPTHNLLKAGKISEARIEGFELNGKTLGIIGCGRIGLHAAKIARGFGMKILVFDIIVHEEWAKEYGFSYVPLDELLAAADAITLHVPSNKHTRHMINEAAFSKMKEGVVLVNTSRGDVIDTEAMLAALRSGKLRGAGLDVVEEENFINNEGAKLQERLLAQQNVVMTPHNAYNSREALRKRLDATIANINAFTEGKELTDRLV